MKNIGVFISKDMESNKRFFIDVLHHNILPSIIEIEPVKTTKTERQQGFGKRKIEVKIILILED